MARHGHCHRHLGLARLRLTLPLCLLLLSPPLLADPPHEPLEPLSGAALSGLRGPRHFAAQAAASAPHTVTDTLIVQRLSVDLELDADLVVARFVYELDHKNPEGPVRLGFEQPAADLGDGRLIAARPPLAARAWVDNKPVKTLQIGPLTGGKGPGYTVTLTPLLPEGPTVLAVTLVLQAVGNTQGQGFSQPAGGGPSWVAFQLNHYAWDWSSPDEPPPTVRVRIRPTASVNRATLVAEAWTDGATTNGQAWFWTRAPWIALRYQGADLPRATSHDALRRHAIARVGARAPAPIAFPTNLTAANPPGRAAPQEVVSPSRARRALLVPAVAIGLLFLLAYGYLRRRTAP